MLLTEVLPGWYILVKNNPAGEDDMRTIKATAISDTGRRSDKTWHLPKKTTPEGVVFLPAEESN
jgi:hypothetical protein